MAFRQVGLRLPEDIVKQLDKYAADTRINRSTAVRLAVIAFLDNYEGKPDPILPKADGLTERVSQLEAKIEVLLQSSSHPSIF